MPKADDPYYNRKPVPDEFIQDVAPSGLSRQEEFDNRERKMSVNGVDLRKFGTKADSGFKPSSDPYYGRKQVDNAHLEGVGDTGLTEEEEYDNRERKMSVNGVDLRRFGMKADSGFKPQSDPYYGRKSVSGTLTKGIGDTYNSPAEDYAIRERKMSAVNFSSDPFQLVSGRGTRQSVSDQGGAAGVVQAATERRRSSAIDPSVTRAAQNSHSGYQGDHLAPIQSRTDEDQITSSSATGESSASGALANGGNHHDGGHTNFYDQATTTTTTTTTTTVGGHGGVHRDYEDVAPDQRV